MDQPNTIRRGMAVMSSDGVQLGRVIDVMPDALLIEKGQFFLRDFRVSIDDISTVRGEELILMRDHTALRKADSEVPAGSVPSIEEELRPRLSIPPGPSVPLLHEPPVAERRAAGPGWDPLSVDEEQKEPSRTSGPDPKAPTRY